MKTKKRSKSINPSSLAPNPNSLESLVEANSKLAAVELKTLLDKYGVELSVAHIIQLKPKLKVQ